MENDALKDVILQLAALSGEVSEIAVYMLHASEKYITKLLWTMQNDKLIIRSDKDNVAGYRLSQSGKKYLTETYPTRYAHYFHSGGITSKVRLDAIHRRRYHRMSEVNTMLYNTGAAIFPGTKPAYDTPFAVGSQPSPSQSSQSSQARYHTSFEIKGDGDESIKIAGSRSMGLLRARSGAYLLYHTHTGPIKWEEMTEHRTRMLFTHKLGMAVRSVMMGEDMDCGLTLLQSDGGKLNRYYKVIPETQPDMLYIPRNRDGEFLLRFVALTDAYEQLKEKLTAGLQKKLTRSLICDGYLDDQTGVLFGCDFDMVRLMQFRMGIEVRKMKGVVYCFDFQADVLRRYFDGAVTLRVMDSKAIANVLGFQ